MTWPWRTLTSVRFQESMVSRSPSTSWDLAGTCVLPAAKPGFNSRAVEAQAGPACLSYQQHAPEASLWLPPQRGAARAGHWSKLHGPGHHADSSSRQKHTPLQHRWSSYDQGGCQEPCRRGCGGRRSRLWALAGPPGLGGRRGGLLSFPARAGLESLPALCHLRLHGGGVALDTDRCEEKLMGAGRSHSAACSRCCTIPCVLGCTKVCL